MRAAEFTRCLRWIVDDTNVMGAKSAWENCLRVAVLVSSTDPGVWHKRLYNKLLSRPMPNDEMWT